MTRLADQLFLAVLVLMAVGSLWVHGCGASAQTLAGPEVSTAYGYRFTRTDRTQASRACVHEATWAGASNTGDCGGIIQVVMERRHVGETFTEALARTMPRFASGRTSRAWVLALPAGPLRDDPEGWPYPYPARHHADVWQAVNLRVQAYMLGTEALPCAPAPRRWFGRETDSDALAATLETGRWAEATCGETRNAFLVAVDRD